MTRNQVIFVLVQVLVLAAWGLVVLGWKYLVRRAESAGAEPSARALEQVRASLAQVTQASSLYVERQHEVFTEVYQHLRRSHDSLALITENVTIKHDIRGLTAEELDAELREAGWSSPARRDVLALWDTGQGRTDALRLLQSRLPLMYYDAAMASTKKAINSYSANMLYFSDAAIEEISAELSALRRYGDAMQYGKQRVSTEELALRRKAMDEGLDQVYSLLRRELKEPGANATASVTETKRGITQG